MITELAGDRHLRLLHASAFGEPNRPALERKLIHDDLEWPRPTR